MNGEKFFTFRSNKELLNYASSKVERLRDEDDRDDALQEAWADLLESSAETVEEAQTIFNRAISRVGMRAIRHDRRQSVFDSFDYIDLGDGNYQRKAHPNSSEIMHNASLGFFKGLNIDHPFERHDNRIESDDFGPHARL